MGTSVGPLRIDRYTGELVLTSPLDFETTALYMFNVVATNDAGGVVFNDTSAVQFEVLNANDNSPMFDDDVYSVSVAEGDYQLTPTVLPVSVGEVCGRLIPVCHNLQ